MLDQIKEYNKCIRDLLFMVLETFSGALVAGALAIVFFGTWMSTPGFIAGFFAAIVMSAIALVIFAFAFGIFFMMMDIKTNTERTANAMEKLAGMTEVATKVEVKASAEKPTAKKAPAKKAAPKTAAKKTTAAKKAPAKKAAPKKTTAKKK
ncbi:MAG: hypothetical protein VX730_02785 [Pseudomonadota bacterium]|nr:hypothetical protein [Pseudomonadota bacterium]